MRRESLFELLNSKHFRSTLKYMRRYEAYLRHGITYEQLHQIMEYDYRVFLEKELKKEGLFGNARSRLKEEENLPTNITSKEDAECKFKALSLARENVK